MDQFLIDVFNKAMYEEEFSQAAPLNFEITRIGQYPPFHIMYEKGASIIRMMSHFLTPEVFQKGLHIYLNKMSESIARSYLRIVIFIILGNSKIPCRVICMTDSKQL